MHNATPPQDVSVRVDTDQEAALKDIGREGHTRLVFFYLEPSTLNQHRSTLRGGDMTGNHEKIGIGQFASLPGILIVKDAFLFVGELAVVIGCQTP